jgi:hypothetical protein
MSEAPIQIVVTVVVLVLAAILWGQWMPNSVFYLFASDLFHQLLFYVGGVLAFMEWMLMKYFDTPLEKQLFTSIVLILFFFCCFQAFKDEHQNSQTLIGDKAELTSERNFWKEQSEAKDGEVRQRDRLLETNFTTLSGTQRSLAGLSHKILDITKPEPTRITMHAIPIKQSDAPAAILVAHTNNSIAGFKGKVKCDRAFHPLQITIPNAGGQMNAGYAGTMMDSEVNFQFGAQQYGTRRFPLSRFCKATVAPLTGTNAPSSSNKPHDLCGLREILVFEQSN